MLRVVVYEVVLKTLLEDIPAKGILLDSGSAQIFVEVETFCIDAITFDWTIHRKS